MKKSLLTAMLCSCAGMLWAQTAGWDNISPLRDPLPYWSESFEGSVEHDLKVEFRNGAAGSVKYITSGVRSGKKALQITKSNHEGYILITPRVPYCGKMGTQLQSEVFVRCTNSNFEYTPGFIRMFGKKEDLSYFKKLDGRGPGGPKMQFIANTAPGVWERKLARWQIDSKSGTAVTPAIVVSGVPSVSVWDDWQIRDLKTELKRWEAMRKRRSDTKNYDVDMIPQDEFEKALAADIDHTGKVVKINGTTRLLIDGKITAPAIYKAKNSSLDKNVFSGKVLEKSGLTIQMNPIRFGKTPRREFGIWSKDKFDVASGVELVRKAMRSAPKSNFILSVSIDPYVEFTAEHPDEVWVHHTGQVVYGGSVHADYYVERQKGWPWISMHSLVYREAVKKNLAILIDELKRTGLSKRIVGMHIEGLHDGQFAVRHLDYGKPATAAYRKYLRQKYGTVTALKKAWNRDDITGFETVMPPQPDRSKRMLSPENDRETYDFFYFQKNAPFRMQEDLARHIRKCFGKEIFFIRYCMGAFDGVLNGAYDITSFINSKEIDIICAQPPYSRRTPAVGCGVRLPLESFHRNGKMLVLEFDLRTYAAISPETELRNLGLSYAADFPMWQSINRKMAGQMIARNMGYWYLDMAPGWFAAPEIAKDIGNAVKTYRKLLKLPNSWKPDTAYVMDEAGMMWRNVTGHYYNFDDGFINGNQLNLLASSGVPFDLFMFEDVLKDPAALKRYKTIVFGGAYNLDPPRQKLVKSLENSNRTLVFLSGTGSVGGSEATGFKIVKTPAPQDHEIVPEAGAGNMLSSMHMAVFTEKFNAGKDRYSQPDRFHVVPEKGVNVVARYKKDRAPAVVWRNNGDFRTVYIADAGGLTPEYFNRLVKEAGGFVASRCGLQVEMNGNFVSVHCIMPGRYTLTLPQRSTVINGRNNKKIAAAVTEITIDAVAGSTYWFMLQPSGK